MLFIAFFFVIKRTLNAPYNFAVSNEVRVFPVLTSILR